MRACDAIALAALLKQNELNEVVNLSGNTLSEAGHTIAAAFEYLSLPPLPPLSQRECVQKL